MNFILLDKKYKMLESKHVQFRHINTQLFYMIYHPIYVAAGISAVGSFKFDVAINHKIHEKKAL